VTSFLH